MMRYWAYYNWRAKGHVIKVHAAHCPFCRDGEGVLGGTRRDNGAWHLLGDLATPAEAVAKAAKISAKAEVRLCNAHGERR